MAASTTRPFQSIVTLRTALVAAGAVADGVVLLYFGGRDSLWKHHQGLQALATGLGTLFIVSIGLGLFWELAGRRSFAREILEAARTSTEVDSAGLAGIGTNYLENVDWAALFAAGPHNLDIFLAYGNTWRATHQHRLQELVNQRGARINVYLPDPTETAGMERPGQRFSKTAAEVAGLIETARRDYQAMSQPGGAEINVFYRPGDPVFTCYRFDGIAILTFYSHKGRGGVPTLIWRAGGTLYSFVRDELDAIREQSHAAPTT